MVDNGLVIDGFCGFGGATLGMSWALDRPVDIAINHNADAILLNKTNNPETLYITEDIFVVDILKYTRGRHVWIMWASADCTHHSKAKGSQPRENGLRMLPWAVYKHARVILPDIVIMENVVEIQDWGPLDENKKPIKDRKGEDYNYFINAMKSLGYKFESRELVAADYGAPTTRLRWYGISRRDGQQISWPVPTHNKCGTDGLHKWESISKYLDWSDLGYSIFTRKKPLKEKTLNRIAKGINKFIIKDDNRYILPDNIASSFLIQYHSETKDGYVRGQGLNEPIKTIDTSNRYGLVTAFITKFYKTGVSQSLHEPIHTITTSAGHFGLVSAFLVKYYGNSDAQSVNEPIDTITTKDRFGLVSVIIEGEKYQIIDIYFRMLKPEELKLGQGFPKEYIIDRDYYGRSYPKVKAVERIGNSVVPVMAKALTQANIPDSYYQEQVS